MALLQHGALQPNNWRHVGDDAAIPADGPVTVSLKRWQAETDALRGRNAPIGVRLKNDEQAQALGDDVHRLSVIEVEFPKFTDGRAFSQARILRDKLGYQGEVRGIGTILRDQFLYMTRCGIDTVELPEGKPIDGYLAALGEFTAWYQPASDGRKTVLELRHAANANAQPNAQAGGAALLSQTVAAHSA